MAVSAYIGYGDGIERVKQGRSIESGVYTGQSIRNVNVDFAHRSMSEPTRDRRMQKNRHEQSAHADMAKRGICFLRS